MIGAEGAPSGIPMTEIEAYGRMFGYDTFEDRFDLMMYVRFCDDVWLEYVGNKRRDSAKHKPKGGGRLHGRGARRS